MMPRKSRLAHDGICVFVPAQFGGIVKELGGAGKICFVAAPTNDVIIPIIRNGDWLAVAAVVLPSAGPLSSVEFAGAECVRFATGAMPIATW